MTYVFNHIIGQIILDQNSKILDIISPQQTLPSKYSSLEPLPQNKLFLALAQIKDQKYYSQFKQLNRLLNIKAMQQSVNEDQLIIQGIANINELDKLDNILSKRLREWYSLHFPELGERITDHEKYAKLLLEKTKAQLISEIKQTEESMGAELSELHLAEIKLLAHQILSLYELRHKHEQYLETVLKQYAPNLQHLAGTTIAAKLIELGRSLKNLALLPASTIQLLGAEKALFRHIKTGSRSPKYGVIINHPLIQHAKRDEKGKASRSLADKLALCARLDYFKGEFKASQYKQDLETKFK